MIIKAIKTRKFTPPKDSIDDLLENLIPYLEERSIAVITSKVISICEGRCILKKDVTDKDDLIIMEADEYLPREFSPGGWVMHTVKNNILLPSSGVDESNAKGYYILWPKNPDLSALKIWKYLKSKTNLKKFGVLITDSHSEPLRRGLVGIALAFYGFNPLIDYRGKSDLFGRTLMVSMTNIPDSLASAAVLAMGEGNEQTPIAVVSALPKTVVFTTHMKTKKPFSSFKVPMNEDLFKPFITTVPWKKGGNGEK